jgi:integrase/recombinase XerD
MSDELTVDPEVAEPQVKQRRRRALRVELWPEQDRAAWARAQRTGDLLEDDGVAAEWRPATIRAATGAYGRWLNFLRRHDRLDVNAVPQHRVTPKAVSDYVGELRTDCSSVTVASEVGVLEMMLKALAPGSDWAWLRRMQARLQLTAEPSRCVRQRIVPAQDIVQLGHDLMAQAEASGPVPTLTSALTYRDGLMIALLALRPLRHRNFVTLEFGRTLVPTGTGYAIRIPAVESKTHRPLAMPFPEALLPHLRRYLDHYRPFLLSLRATRGRNQPQDNPPGGRLWVTQYGLALTEKGPIVAIRRRTAPRFGRPINTHLVRHCVASTAANEGPEMIGLAASLLGHGDLHTTELHYIVAKSRVAAKGLQDVLRALRQGATPGSTAHHASSKSSSFREIGG